MSALTVASRPRAGADDGLMRSARLMRALGPEAAPIWAELAPGEVRALSAAMDQIDEDSDTDHGVLRAFVAEHAHAPSKKQAGSVWSRLSALETGRLASLLEEEHAQTVALILSRLESDAAARVLRTINPDLAVDSMQRLLHLGNLHPEAMRSLEAALGRLLDAMGDQSARSGHEQIARIFDKLDSRMEKAYLTALDTVEPGAGRKVRALMFTFDDLARLDAAGLQTLLSAADRADLVMALKGAKPETAAAFFKNLTQRAGELLREDIAELGAVRRSEVEVARQKLVHLAKTLVDRGDIRAGGRPGDEDELVE